MAEEIYREWFVRMRFPGYEQARFHKGVPEGWEVKKLPGVAEITYGFPFDGGRFNAGGIGKPIIRIRNIPEADTSDYTDQVVPEKYVVRNGDLLVGMDGEFHINHWFGGDAYLVQRSCKIEARQNRFKGYLALAVVSPIKYFESILQGATVGHLGAKHLNSIEIIVPGQTMNNELLTLNNLLDGKVKVALANRNLRRSRDLLLSRLITGKLSVENLDIEFPPSMRNPEPVEEREADA